MGGVASGRDAFELILAGASAISIGTATFGNPIAAMQIKEQLSELLTQKGFNDFRDAIGFAHRGI
jgi:dihydroorotate dehydrogenase (NAD+) catalytic subunit